MSSAAVCWQTKTGQICWEGLAKFAETKNRQIYLTMDEE
jgi:hypothetical protein